jgi:hypothetical protein
MLNRPPQLACDFFAELCASCGFFRRRKAGATSDGPCVSGECAAAFRGNGSQFLPQEGKKVNPHMHRCSRPTDEPPEIAESHSETQPQESTMTEELMLFSDSNHRHVNVNEEQEVQYWMQRFAVSEEALRRAVADVGVDAEDIAEHLQGAAQVR